MIGDKVTRYLKEHGIQYIESGPDVAKGNVNIKCPWCGDSDIGHHLGINLRTGYYGCWRSKAHRSKDILTLLYKLTGESKNVLREVILGTTLVANNDVFSRIASGKFYTPVEVSLKDAPTLTMPSKYKVIKSVGATKRFWDYLQQTRKFGDKYTSKVVSRYKLLACLTGAFKDRIIMPIFMDRKLVCWTSRSIHKEAQVRYMSLPDKEPEVAGYLDIAGECGLATVNVKSTLYNYDLCNKGGKLLLVVEGPLDAMKIDCVGWRHGVRCVGMFNTAASQEQVFLLKDLSRLYSRVLVILDPGFVVDAVDAASKIGKNTVAVAFESLPVPKYAEDLGSLKMMDAIKLVEYLLVRYK